MGLLNSTVLEWAIGIVFVYLLLAIICTTINEWVAGITRIRSATLSKAIKQLLDDQPGSSPAGTSATETFLQQFYAHPLMAGMMKPGKPLADGHPAYLQARTFATVVMDLATTDQPGSITFDQLESGINKLPSGDVKKSLLALIQNAAGDLNAAQKNIENWFNDTMERASGWYKHRAQIATVVVASLLTIATNADTVRIGHLLWTDGTLRSMMVEQSKKRPDASTPANKSELESLTKLLGWSSDEWVKGGDWRAWPARLLGWFLTIAAISLGAPFWFDLLNKFMNLRNAGTKPESPPSKQDGTSPPPIQIQIPAKVAGS
jgi:hypothetical protein